MEIRRGVQALQLPTHWNLTTQPVVAHIEQHQIIQFGQLCRNTPRDPVMVQVHGSQAGGKHHFGQIKFQHVPRQIHNLGGLVQTEYYRRVAFELVA
jgi:hypothetical protein